MNVLLLFDIDGTLISTAGTGIRSMTQAFEDVFGVPDALREIPMAGSTDPLILKQALEKHGITPEVDQVSAFQERYETILRKLLTNPLPGKRVLPGIRETLEILQEKPNCLCGLLTGNWKRTAMVKLEYFHLDHFFLLGAFADEAEYRPDLFHSAERQYRELFDETISADKVVIIGDTPNDIRVADVHAAKSVAVATGSFSTADLGSFHPHLCLESFEDNRTFLRFLDDCIGTVSDT